MLSFLPKLKVLTASLMIVAYMGLTAQNAFRVAVLEPVTDTFSESHKAVVKNAITSAVSANDRFTLLSSQDQTALINAQLRNRDSIFHDKATLVEMGMALNANYIVASNVSFSNDSYTIACEITDVRTHASVTRHRVVESERAARINSETTNMVNEILGEFIRRTSGNKRVSAVGHPSLEGLGGEISRSLKSFRGVARWNRLRNTSDIEVDLSNVRIIENTQYSSPVYRISGAILIYLTDSNGNSGDAEVKIADFTESDIELIQKRIVALIESSRTAIVRDLIETLNENNS
jgi:hypothetical protein